MPRFMKYSRRDVYVQSFAFASWQEAKMIVVANGVKMFVVAVHLFTNFTKITIL